LLIVMPIRAAPKSSWLQHGISLGSYLTARERPFSNNYSGWRTVRHGFQMDVRLIARLHCKTKLWRNFSVLDQQLESWHAL
jgi:hypothetical protein